MATTTEVNPVSSASTSPGTMSALGNPAGSLSTTPDLSSLVTDPSTLQSTPGWDSFLSSIDTSGTPAAGTGGNTDFLSGLAGAFGGTTSTSPASGDSTTGSSIGSWLTNLLTGNPASGGLAGIGPYAAVGAAGIAQAKATQSQDQKYVQQLAALGGPQTAAGQALLKQFQAGQLTPQQQQVVDTSQKQGSDLMSAAAPLSAIAQQAYQNYQSGTLPPADEQRIKDQVAQQQQQIRQQLASQGITDSSILAGYDQQIQNQADETRQSLLDARFATGNQAYDRWLTTTQAGQQLQLQGQQYAVTSLDTMLNQSLGLTAQGMEPVAQSIQLAIQSDTQLSQQINDLIGNLSAAYAYQASGGGRGLGWGAGVGGAAGSTSNLLSSIMGGVKGVNTAVKGYDAISGLFGGGTTGAAGAADAASIAGGWAADAASTDAALAGLSADTGLATSTTAADIAAGNEAWLSGLGGDFSAAGGEAAGSAAAGGGGAAAAGGGEAAGAAAGGSEAGASSAGLGAGAGVALAAAPFAAILGKMFLNPDDVMLKAPYWEGLSQSLQGSNVNTSAGAGGADAKKYAISDAVQEALSTPQDQVPQAIQQQVWATGLVPYGTWGVDPNVAVGQGTGGKAGPSQARRNYAE